MKHARCAARDRDRRGCKSGDKPRPLRRRPRPGRAWALRVRVRVGFGDGRFGLCNDGLWIRLERGRVSHHDRDDPDQDLVEWRRHLRGQRRPQARRAAASRRLESGSRRPAPRSSPPTDDAQVPGRDRGDGHDREARHRQRLARQAGDTPTKTTTRPQPNIDMKWVKRLRTASRCCKARSIRCRGARSRRTRSCSIITEDPGDVSRAKRIGEARRRRDRRQARGVAAGEPERPDADHSGRCEHVRRRRSIA